MELVSQSQTLEDSLFAYDDANKLIVASHRNRTGDMVEYDGSGDLIRFQSVQPHVGGTSDLIQRGIDGSLASAEQKIYTFTITQSELASTANGRIGFVAEVSGANGFQPDIIEVPGGAR